MFLGFACLTVCVVHFPHRMTSAVALLLAQRLRRFILRYVTAQEAGLQRPESLSLRPTSFHFLLPQAKPVLASSNTLV